MQIHTHLFLVHEDMIPNITPALDPEFRPKEVFLLCSPNSNDQTERLELILKESGIDVSRWPLNDPWDIEHVRERVLEFVANHDRENIVLNVTGGTQPMSLAAYEIFRDMQKPIYYVQTERDYVVWLYPRDWASFDLADEIKLSQYLKAHDIHLVNCLKDGISENYRELTATLIEKVEKFDKPLLLLNALASQSKSVGTLVTTSIKEDSLRKTELRDLIDLFVSNKLIERLPENMLRFMSKEALEYINGGWLEEHVYGVLYNLRKEIPTIQDLARNVEVKWGSKRRLIDNEFDVAFLADNRLYIIECKTKKFSDDMNPYAAAAQAIYKLDALRDNMGGVGTRAMFVSYHDLDKFARDRANGLGIAICCHKEIHYIEDFFKSWINKSC